MKGIIIYKGKYGSNEQYAKWLSDELGMPMASADKITGDQLKRFDFFILGTSVYVGKLQISEWMKKNFFGANELDYSKKGSLAVFTGTHPQVMQERIKKMNWKFSFDPTQKKLSLKLKVLMFIEKKFGWKPGEYKNYKIK